MKRVINQSRIEATKQQIVAMSTINPKLCKEFGIDVEVEQRDEGPVPHLHVYHDRTRDPKKCSYIRLDKAEYSDHHSQPSAPLPKKVKKQFVEIMKQPWGKQAHISPDGSMRVATGYEASVDTWVDTYEDGDYSKFTLDTHGDPVMPDYTQL